MDIWRLAFPRLEVTSLSSPFGPSPSRLAQRRLGYYGLC
jgi:hypothetical protein